MLTQKQDFTGRVRFDGDHTHQLEHLPTWIGGVRMRQDPKRIALNDPEELMEACCVSWAVLFLKIESRRDPDRAQQDATG